MARGTVFGNEHGYQPNAVNVRVRAIKLGQRSMENPDVLDDLSRIMREADDQLERAKVQGRINAAFASLTQEEQIQALRSAGVETDFTVAVRGESFQ